MLTLEHTTLKYNNITHDKRYTQIDKAFDYMQRSVDADAPGARYAVTIATGGPPGVTDPR